MKKKKYCPTVCNKARMPTHLIELRLGRKKRRDTIEPKRIVITPASTNLAPASISLDAVSSDEISKISYAILIAGDALPHNTQQNNAVIKVIGR